MKRTDPYIFLAFFLEYYVFSNHLDNVGPFFYRLNSSGVEAGAAHKLLRGCFILSGLARTHQKMKCRLGKRVATPLGQFRGRWAQKTPGLPLFAA